MSKWEDVTKLLNARFTVVRAEEYGTLVIKKAVLGAQGGVNWIHMEKGFYSKNELHRRMREILKDPKTIEG